MSDEMSEIAQSSGTRPASYARSVVHEALPLDRYPGIGDAAARVFSRVVGAR
jgi:hypothetical protein